jgi:predicted DNA-binding mobile mystery protein A
MTSTLKHRARQALDEKLSPLRPASRLAPPPKGWVRAVREALGMSGAQFAARLGVTRQSMDDLEKSEAAGSIQLATLRRAAAALDCQLAYALVPNSSLEKMVSDRSRDIAVRDLSRVARTMALEDQEVQSNGDGDEVEAYVRDHVRDRDVWAAK